MRAVVQRVADASVSVDGAATGRVEKGILVYVGVARGDTEDDAVWMADKAANLRIFEDADGKMNLSVVDVGGSALVVSQFTLLADARKGRRPSYSGAADPSLARELYERFVDALRGKIGRVETGVFQAEMAVRYTNQGPVTILLDSKGAF
jgi:D-tyrosyl-tRNA(Tyr) deacylase